MEILKAGKLYNQWHLENPDTSSKEKLIVRCLLATNDVATTLFITDSTFEQVIEVYSKLDGDWINHGINESDDNIKEKHQLREHFFNEKEETSTGTKKRLDRKKAISFISDKLVNGNLNLKILGVRYNTIEVQFENGETARIKILTSRDYKGEEYNREKICCSWHKELDTNITDYDFHIYAVECHESYKALIFTTNDLQIHLSNKIYNNNFVNYYFHWHSDGTVTDERDTAIPIFVTRFDADKINWRLNKI
ncbi:hypothetical protein ACIQV0_18195 [Lysinibacillus capsici]|uniref:hypothetical protein n=1 Tax=Lysinibacillus capsici TaxID=2115968 RepID=UPI00381DECBD